MPFSSSLITLSNVTPTEIVGHDNMPHDVILHNQEKSANHFIYLGGTGVTTTNAIHMDPGDTVSFTLQPGDRLYAVSDPDGLKVGVLDIRQQD